MKTYTETELAEIIEKHGKWRRGNEGGECANLGGANLGGANLGGANLGGASGNCSEIKAIQCDIWPVTYTAERMQIGCQFHTIAEWREFGDDEISHMDSEALAWWRIWKPILQTIIAASPAVPGRIEE